MRLPWDGVAGRIAGHAYVGLETAADARRALSLSGAILGDRNIAVTIAADPSGMNRVHTFKPSIAPRGFCEGEGRGRAVGSG